MSNIQLPLQVESRRMVMHNLDVLYPYIISGTNAYAIQKMNQQIMNLVKRLIIEQGYYQNPQTTQVYGSFEIKNNQRGVFSLNIINYTYIYQHAHGMTITKSLTFDIQTGKVYELKDLFKPGSDYTKVLSEIVQKQIKEREIPVIEEFKGIKPDQDYYIADKALVVYYQLYELAPYAYGFPMFVISVYEVDDIVKEDGPFGVMIG